VVIQSLMLLKTNPATHPAGMPGDLPMGKAA
jgi:hypothetical protein